MKLGGGGRLKPIFRSQSHHIIEIPHVAGYHDPTVMLCRRRNEPVRVTDWFAVAFSLSPNLSREKGDGRVQIEHGNTGQDQDFSPFPEAVAKRTDQCAKP